MWEDEEKKKVGNLSFLVLLIEPCDKVLTLCHSHRNSSPHRLKAVGFNEKNAHIRGVQGNK